MSRSNLNIAHLDDDTLFESFMGSDGALFEATSVRNSARSSLPIVISKRVDPLAALLPMKSSTLPRFDKRPPSEVVITTEGILSMKFDQTLEKVDLPSESRSNAPLPNLTSNFVESPPSSTAMTCSDHRDRTLDVFCMVCNTPICTSCAIFGKHTGHRCIPVDQAFKSCSAELRNHLNQLEHRTTSIRAFLAELSSLRIQLNSSAESCAEQVRNNIQFLKVSLDQRMNALLKEITEVRDNRVSHLDSQQQSLTEDLANSEKLLTLANSMLDSNSGTQFLKKHKFLCEQVQAASQNHATLQAVIEPDIPLKMNVSVQTKAINELTLTGSTAFGNRASTGYTSNLDKNGIFYYLGTVGCGTDEFTGPVTTGLVEISASEWGYCDHIDRVCWQENPSSVFTGGKFGSWICFRFNQGYRAKPNRYRIQHAGDCASHTLRNWVFEGSVDNSSWDVLSIHNNDQSIADSEGAHASWEIAAASIKRAYSHFRITITGPNSAAGHHLMLGSIELWGVMEKDGVTKK